MLGLLLGAACGAVSALLFALLAMKTGFYLHTLTLALVVPAGGALAGIAAGLGMAGGTMAVTGRATRERKWLAALLGVAVYLAIYAYLWRAEAPDLSFNTWLNAAIDNSMRSMFVGVGRPVRLGMPGTETPAPLVMFSWVRFGLQFAGAALGSFLTFELMLGDQEPCPVCAKAYRAVKLLFRAQAGEPGTLLAQFRALKEPNDVRIWLAKSREDSGAPPEGSADFIAVRLVKCACGTGKISFGWRALDGNGDDFARSPASEFELRRDMVRLLSE